MDFAEIAGIGVGTPRAGRLDGDYLHHDSRGSRGCRASRSTNFMYQYASTRTLAFGEDGGADAERAASHFGGRDDARAWRGLYAGAAGAMHAVELPTLLPSPH